MRQFIAVMLSLALVTSSFAQSPSSAGSSGSGTPVRTSAVRNSFNDLTSHLDPGGNIYLYLSTEELLKGLSQQISQWRALFESIPDANSEDRENIGRVFDVIANLVKNSGVEEVSGFGMSSIAIEKDLYRVTSMLHHYKGDNKGYLWSLFGKKPHSLDGLNLMPSNAALAWYTDLDLPMLWTVLNDEIGKSGFPGATEAMASLPEAFHDMTGADLEKVLGSLGGEYGIAMTLDETRMMALPGPDGEPIEIPEIGGLAIVKTKNDTIFNLIDETMGGDPQVFKTDRAGFKMRTITPPADVETSLRPAIAQAGDYLIIASNSALIEEAVAVKAGSRPGLKSSDEFKRLSQGVPTEGNSFSFVSPRVGKAIARLQAQIIESSTPDPAQRQMFTNLLGGSGGGGSYGVAANTEEGWISTGNTTQNPASAIMLPLMVVPLIVSSIAIPSLLRSRQAANESAAIANLHAIATAEALYYLDKNKYGDMAALVKADLLDVEFLDAVNGYEYEIDASLKGDFLARATPVDPNSGRWEFYVMSEGVVRYSIDPDLSPPGESGKPVESLPARRGVVRNAGDDSLPALALKAP